MSICGYGCSKELSLFHFVYYLVNANFKSFYSGYFQEFCESYVMIIAILIISMNKHVISYSSYFLHIPVDSI